MSRTIRKLVAAGGVVLIGRGAHIICANLSNALHVRLVAPLESRVQHIADYFKLSEKDAAQYVEKPIGPERSMSAATSARTSPILINTILSSTRANWAIRKPPKLLSTPLRASARRDRQLGKQRSAMSQQKTPG